ncbi:hypothetical protein QOZ80_1AG0008130 [Eleusine coracana subsp. coracana]|nr:hypothetical protein QOZ80_1AG0008130 [Eleusine coracana subsp. coracana]
MKTCVVSILLVLSLAGLSAAAISEDSIMDAIRLPSEITGLDDLFAAMKKRATTTQGELKKSRPWKCCDLALCTRTNPPTCRCLDKVDRCSNACDKCEETEDSRYTCKDWYSGNPGPMCNKQDDDERPWNCCNNQICTRSMPPTCRCFDVVDQCAKGCKRCQETMTGWGYRCLDSYFGDMAPPCDSQGGKQ